MSRSIQSSEVKVIGRHTLRCADPRSLDKLQSPFRLGPLDSLELPFSLIGVNYVYRKPPSVDELIPLGRFRRALMLLLDYYPHLTGRLQVLQADRSQSPIITNLGKGAELVVATCDTTLDELASHDTVEGRVLAENLPSCGSALLTDHERTLEAVRHDPVFTVQHTRFACGGVALGITLRHLVCDGHGYFQLVRDLAQIYRALRDSELANRPLTHPILPAPPEIRSFLSSPTSLTPQDRRAALSHVPESVSLWPPSNDPFPALRAESSRTTPVDAPPIIGRQLRFSARELAALKKHATNPDPNSSGWVSTFEVLTAHLMQRIYLARLTLLLSSSPSPTVIPSSLGKSLSRTFLASMNIRSPARFNLSPRYFANATYGPTADFPHALLGDANTPLWRVAEAVHDVFRSVTPEKIEKTVKWVAAQPDRTRVKRAFEYSEGSFLVSQWSCFGVYEGVEYDFETVEGEGDGNGVGDEGKGKEKGKGKGKQREKVGERVKGIAPVLVAGPMGPGRGTDGLALVLSTEEDLEEGGKRKGGKALDVVLTLSEPVWAVLERDREFRRFKGA